MREAEKVISLIDKIWDHHKDVRGHYQYQIPTDNHARRQNEIGHWLNQGFLIRLYVLLEDFGVVEYGKAIPDNQWEGEAEVKLLKKLRNAFAHGWYFEAPGTLDQQKLAKKIADHFHLEDYQEGKDIVIDISRVIRRIVESCKRYVRAAYSANNPTP